ncbi:MAG: hypothetical protein ACFFDT_39250, partial [Candidatus Hodarchaeota archaeon]
MVELRDKTFKPTNTTTTAIFARKRNMNIVIDSLRRAKNLNTKKESKFLQEISLKMDMSIDKILKSIEDDSYIIDVMISEFSV